MWFVPHQSCSTCKDPRASVHTFKKLMWLLDPQYKDASKKHYKAFDDLFGENTSEIECPSAKIYLVKMEWVRATKPAAAQMEQLSVITGLLQYSCGAPLIPEDHMLSSVFVVRQDVSCADPADKLWIRCWCCTLEPEARINDQKRATYKVVDPVCQECVSSHANRKFLSPGSQCFL